MRETLRHVRADSLLYDCEGGVGFLPKPRRSAEVVTAHPPRSALHVLESNALVAPLPSPWGSGFLFISQAHCFSCSFIPRVWDPIFSCSKTHTLPSYRGPDDPSKPIRLTNGTFNNDKFRPYLAAINPKYRDTKGRWAKSRATVCHPTHPAQLLATFSDLDFEV